MLDDEGNVISQEIDLGQSIYIDWGAFINAVINFFLIAFVLFTILKLINKVREEHREFSEKIAEKTLDKKERKELRAHGIKIRDKEAVRAYFEEKKRLAAEAAAKTKAEAEEKARIEREQNPTSEDLLKKILEVISKYDKKRQACAILRLTFLCADCTNEFMQSSKTFVFFAKIAKNQLNALTNEGKSCIIMRVR